MQKTIISAQVTEPMLRFLQDKAGKLGGQSLSETIRDIIKEAMSKQAGAHNMSEQPL